MKQAMLYKRDIKKPLLILRLHVAHVILIKFMFREISTFICTENFAVEKALNGPYISDKML